MRRKPGELGALIERVSDGDKIDWEAEKSSLGKHAALLDQLRVITRIRDAHGGEPDQVRATPATFVDQESREFVWGPLRVLETIGRGGFGVVHRAWDANLEREVALKLLPVDRMVSDATAGRFLDEARRLARIRHTHVVTVHGAERHDGRVGMWMELVRGRTLEEVLEASGPFGGQECSVIGMDLCRALAAIHAAGLIHGDVKTTNVMREEGGRIVLMDFGAAHLRSGSPGEALSYGTPIAMAPEQLRREPFDARADLYSVGVLLFRLLTARYPSESGSAGGDPPALRLRDLRPDLPPPLVGVVEKAMAPAPSDRFATSGAMEAALAQLVGATVGIAHRDSFRPGARRIGALIALAALAIVAVTWFISRQDALRSDGGPTRRAAASSEASRSSVAPPVPVSRDDPGPSSSARTMAGTEARVAETITARLYRESGGVRSVVNRGDQVLPGDQLSLDLEGASGRHVYVLNEDSDGAVHVLFPIPGVEPGNPLSRSPVLRLPGTLEGRAMNWQVTSPGGEDVLIVLAARKPLRALERDIASLPRAREGAAVVYGRASPEALASLRGIGGMVPASETTPGTRLSDVLGRAPIRDGSVWVWQTQMRSGPGNP